MQVTIQHQDQIIKEYMEQNLNCSVCHDIFNDPVILNCSHSFCKACLQRSWVTNIFRECPLCRVRSINEPVTNRDLKQLCELVLKEKRMRASAGPEVLCHLHGEKLKLFCLEDQQPVCLVCRDAKVHIDHRFHPISDVASEYKEEIQTKLKPLQQKRTLFEQFKMTCDQTLKVIMTQANHTEGEIKQEFQKLRQFLLNEEEASIAALRKEEKQKSDNMKQKIDKVNREILSLSDAIREIEDAVGNDDVTFLKNYKCTIERTKCTLDDPEMISRALIDVASYLGNLKFKVWEKMQSVADYAPVILDPNTAHPNLTVSEDLMCIQYSEQKKQLPDSAERFDEYVSVLGSEGFSSGTHIWDVEVKDSPSWEIGVMLESAKVKGKDEDKYSTGRWIIFYANDEYKAHTGYVVIKIGDPIVPLKVLEKPKKIRVELSFNKNKVSFSDPDNNTLLHTFTHKFWYWNKNGKVVPYFKTNSSLRILPAKATIIVEPPSYS